MKAEDRGPKTERPETWFNTQERLRALETAAVSWIGTPFFSNGNTKGRGVNAGVSCQKLCEVIYRECGFIDVKTPEVQMSHAQSSSKNLVREFMRKMGDSFVDLMANGREQMAELVPGDLIAVKIKQVEHHLGIVLFEGSFIQALDGVGVVISYMSDGVWGSKLRGAWRPIEKQGAGNANIFVG